MRVNRMLRWTWRGLETCLWVTRLSSTLPVRRGREIVRLRSASYSTLTPLEVVEFIHHDALLKGKYFIVRHRNTSRYAVPAACLYCESEVHHSLKPTPVKPLVCLASLYIFMSAVCQQSVFTFWSRPTVGR